MNREVIKAAARGAARLFDFDSSINKRRKPVRSKAPEKRQPLDPVKETGKLMIKSNNIVLKVLYKKIHEQMEKQRMLLYFQPEWNERLTEIGKARINFLERQIEEIKRDPKKALEVNCYGSGRERRTGTEG